MAAIKKPSEQRIRSPHEALHPAVAVAVAATPTREPPSRKRPADDDDGGEGAAQTTPSGGDGTGTYECPLCAVQLPFDYERIVRIWGGPVQCRVACPCGGWVVIEPEAPAQSSKKQRPFDP